MADIRRGPQDGDRWVSLGNSDEQNRIESLPASSPFDELGSLHRDYERYRTTDPGIAEEVISSFLSPHRLSIRGHGQRFAAVGSVAEAGAVSLCLMSYGEEVRIDRPAQDDQYFAILVPMAGRVLVRLKGREFIASPYESLVALPPGERVSLGWSEDCRVLTLRADSSALQRALVGLSSRAEDRPLKLDSARVVGSERYAILGAAATLMHAFANYPSCSDLPRFLVRRLNDHALSTMLLTLTHNHTTDLYGSLTPASGRSVRTALELLHAEDQAMYTIGELAAEAGVTVRALELAFRKDLGTTPSAYAFQIRLNRAHEELRRADLQEGTTVTRVAMKWGFAHVGRFARRYRETFGVTPSEELRRSVTHTHES